MISHKFHFRKHEEVIKFKFLIKWKAYFKIWELIQRYLVQPYKKELAILFFIQLLGSKNVFEKKDKNFDIIFLFIIYSEPFEATVLNAFAIEKERELVLEELKLNRIEALVDFLHNLVLGKN